MASTNEDVVVLATARLDAGRLLVMRHLPDRGTVEIGWWGRTRTAWWHRGHPCSSSRPRPSRWTRSPGCAPAWPAQAGPRPRRAGWSPRLNPLPMASRSWPCAPGTACGWSGSPKGGDLALPSPAALALLAVAFPAARRKLAALGFGLVQQSGQA